MATTINQRELRNDSGEILRRVGAGETFVVTRNGDAVADLSPHRSEQRPPRFVAVVSLGAGADELPPWGVDGFTRETREFDEAIDDEDRDPWAQR